MLKAEFMLLIYKTEGDYPHEPHTLKIRIY